MPDNPLWRGTVEMRWGPNEFGHPNIALYIGKFYVSEIYDESLAARRPTNRGPWRAWMVDNSDGHAVGYYDTEAEARSALVAAAVKALGDIT